MMVTAPIFLIMSTWERNVQTRLFATRSPISGCFIELPSLALVFSTRERTISRRMVFRQFLSEVPFRPVDFSKPAEKAEHDRLVSLVDQTIILHRQAAAAKSPPDKEALERQIRATTREIDRLVYELYGLTEEDIRIVEVNARA